MTESEKTCNRCANLVGRRHYTENAEDWKCHAQENLISTSRDLVTGQTVYHLRFPNCYDCRSATVEQAGCGSEGKWFILYEQPVFSPKIIAGKERTAENLLKELDT
mgnify:CR=1 FL=1